MVVTRQSLIRHLPPAGGAAVGVALAVLVLLVPTAILEQWVWSSGVAALVPAAAPPLGATARALLALGGGVLAGAVTWAALFLLWGPGGVFAAGPVAVDGAPSVRRADAHPDAPPRRPLSAADLGTPPPPAPAPKAPPPTERTLPADLDQPLAQFDPQAILPVPRAPVRPVPPLGPPAAAIPDAAAEADPTTEAEAEAEPVPAPAPERHPEPVDRIETFELTPMVRPPAQRAEPAPPPTIESLLRRLEQGSGRQPARTP